MFTNKSMNLPTISFIIPIYNVDAYVRDAVESVLRQSVDKEIILIDDGSTDQSSELAYQYSQQYPFVTLIHSQNRGVSRARNQGLALARGEFVVFLDADDILNENLPLADLCQLANERNADVINGRYVSYPIENPTSVRHYPTIFPETQGHRFVGCELAHYFQQKILRHWHPILGSLLLRRQFLVQNQLQFSPLFYVSEDMLFWVDMLCCKGTIIEVDVEFIHYRLRPNSLTRSPITERKILDAIRFIEILKARIEQCQNERILFGLRGLLAISYWGFHHETLEDTSPELREKYQSYITPEIIDFYNSMGLHKI